MKLFRLIFVFLVANFVGGVFAFASTPAAAARPETQNLRWKKQVIRIAVSSSLTQPNSNIKTDSDVLGAITRSLKAWSDVSGIEFQVEFTDKQNVSPQGPKGDGVSLITIAQSAENLALFANDPFSEAAMTRVFYNRRGFITESDIVLNPFQQFSTDGTYGTFDFETTFAHEIGHLLGLKHSDVMGSLMSERVAKNTTSRFFDTERSILSESDKTATRSLYGIENEECCGYVSGKLLLPSGKPAKQTLVWAEENTTGQIVGQTETFANGTYSIGGLNNGSYRIFWQRVGGNSESVMGELGTLLVEKNKTYFAPQKLNITRSGISLSYVGHGMQLGNSAVELIAGGQLLIFLGGKNLDVNDFNIEFTSPFIKVLPGSIRKEDFGDSVEAISFVLKTDMGTPTGTYSIFASDRDGRRTAMLGAINIRNRLK